MLKNLFGNLPLTKTGIFLLLLVLVTTASYWNHFGNSFHFDDSHTIENNLFIQDIHNIPLFFKDGTTFSSLPSNQSYRPVVSTSLAIDYWLGNGYDLFYFHLSSFLLFLLMGILLFFLIYHLFEKAYPNSYNFIAAALACSWYMLHPANAETINYIIARSDLQSTFFVVLAFVLYLFSPASKKYHLYLIPVGIGALAKPPAVMFAPMLFVYILLFEEQIPLTGIFQAANRAALWKAIKASIPAFIACAFFYGWVDHFTPKTWQSGGNSMFHYLITQPYVILHYFVTFFLPTDLSADTDWQALTTIADIHFVIGMLFISGLAVLAIWFSKDQRLRPISFGIVWFFLALIPSSSVVPFAEVLNDHRIFFPYIGLAIAVCWTLLLLVRKQEQTIKHPVAYHGIVLSTALILLTAYSFGVRERNKVWATEETLWKDVTEKSPKNARGLMNYGLSKMEKGDYVTAEKYFNDALAMWPYYSFLHVNLGVLKHATGDQQAAEKFFKSGIDCGSNYPDSWYFYGNFLNDEHRYSEAIPVLKKAIELSPAHIGARKALMLAYNETSNWELLTELANNTLQVIPGNPEALSYLDMARNRKNTLEIKAEEVEKAPTAEKYLDLSLNYYQAGNFEKCIQASQQALILNPKFAEAYNNIGISYSKLGKFDEAIAALQKALQLKPDFQLAKNNLAEAQKNKEGSKAQEQLSNEHPSPENFLNLSLTYYQQGAYEKCIDACNKALKLKPDYADAYSNMGAAYNMLKQWDNAIDACNKALKIDPQHKLAKGNLNWALDEKRKLVH